MVKYSKFLIVSLINLCFSIGIFGQSIVGQLINSESGDTEAGILLKLSDTDFETMTNYDGVFKFYDLKPGVYELLYENGSNFDFLQKVQYGGTKLDLGQLEVSISPKDRAQELEGFKVISLADNELEITENEYESSSVLTASRDPFLNTAAFAWGAARFNPRGLTSEYSWTTINGVRINESFNGRVFFGQWGGLNDMFRNLHTNYGLGISEYGVGYMGGTVDFNVRAGSQRAQTRVSYANSNRSYDHRLMFSHSTGFNEKNWALSISGSRRWAQEGYVPGSFYDSWSLFLGLEKKINENHSVHFTAFNNKSNRGKAGAMLLEINEIVDDPYYNPYWGFQNGEKRNSRIGHNNQPMFILGNDLKIKDRTSLSNAISFQFGENGGTALQWLDASNPAADYHRKLPSRIENELVRDQVIEAIKNDPSFFQVNWDYFYEANRNNLQTVDDANGQENNSVTGNFARYIVEDRRDDSKELNINSRLTHELSDNNTLNAGLIASIYKGRHFTELEDLLGADYFLDVDRFADPIANPGSDQKDLNNTNAIKQEGDIFGYDYDSNIQNAGIWLQDQLRFTHFDLFASAELSTTRMWRTGRMKNGFFPDNSFGDSERRSFTNYRGKAGINYKLNRNRLFANGYMGTRAPYFRNAFISPRSNNSYVPLLENVKEKSGELGYAFKSPSVDVRATAYYVDIEDDTELFFFYSEEEFLIDNQLRSGAFGSFINHNVDKRHVGLEFIAQLKLTSTIQVKGAASVGQYLYDSRWRQWAFSDDFEYFREDDTIYSNGFFVETSPQKAFNFEIKYDSPNYWFATVNFNMFGNRYLDFSTDRRIATATSDLEVGSAEYNDVVFQEKVDDAFTVDLFFHKSFKLPNDHFILFTASVSNILNEDFFSGGYEQLRFDKEEGPDFFDTKYYRAYGVNYFIGLTYKL